MTTTVKLNDAPYAIGIAAGTILTVIADALSSGRIWRKDTLRGTETTLEPVAASATVTIGPFGTERRVEIEALAGSLSFSVAPADPLTLAEATLVFAPILTNNVLDLVGDGVPVDYTDGTPPATGEGVAGPGSRYTDITGAKLYINGGTKAQPIWKLVTSA